LGATPFGTTRSADKLASAVALGLVDGLVLTKDLAPLQPAVASWTGSRGIDVTLELVGGAYLTASISAAAPRGRIMLVGTMGGATAEIPLSLVLRKRLTIRGTVLRARSLAEKIDATGRFAREVVPLFAAGALRPVVDRVMRLDQVVEAHRLVESNATVGKVVLEVS
jgi:NADPH:quinone reductase-like Zn-dependent oxidoreductase